MESEGSGPAPHWVEALLEQTNDLAFMKISPDGRIEDWLGAAHVLFRWTSSEVLGKPFALLFTPEDVALGTDAAELEFAAVTGRSEDDRWHRRKDDSVFWGSGVTQAIRDDSGALLGFCKFVRDRTDLRSQIKALENRAEGDAERENASRAQFATVVHELSNPLNAFSSAQFLVQNASDPSVQQRALDIIWRQMDVLRRLVTDLSELSRAQVGSAILHPTRFEVQPSMQAVVAPLQHSASLNGQRLHLVVPATPLFLEADEQRFHQMVLNLVTNALKYAPGGNVTVSLSIEGDSAVVRVEDDGVGISPEALTAIFELFTREERGSSAPAGLGIGLAVVKELARAHGGGVEARSLGKGKGSTFTLRLPLERVRKSSEWNALGDAMKKMP